MKNSIESYIGIDILWQAIDLATYAGKRGIPEILYPMMQILDEKNITRGISVIKENGKLYICFEKNCLSDCNQFILEKIASVYCGTFFYSDNRQYPNADRLEYWCPDEHYDKRTHITERCRKKIMIVLELEENNQLSILGTSLMLANVLQEQDPMRLEVNKELVVLDKDIINRHEHYMTEGCPDLKWIDLSIFLDKDNPLTSNPYATLMRVCEINTPISCDNIMGGILIGYKEKTYISFNMEKEELEKAIKTYLKKQTDNMVKEDKTTVLAVFPEELLTGGNKHNWTI